MKNVLYIFNLNGSAVPLSSQKYSYKETLYAFFALMLALFIDVEHWVIISEMNPTVGALLSLDMFVLTFYKGNLGRRPNK